MLIKYRGQLYKRIDAGEQKIAEVLKRKLQEDAAKAGANIDITGSIDENNGGLLDVWLVFKGPVNVARDTVVKMGESMTTTAKQLNYLPFFKNRYWISAHISTPEGGGSRRKIGYISVEPRKQSPRSVGVSNQPLLNKIGLSENEKRGYPHRSEEYKDQNATDAAKYASDNLEINSSLIKYADRLGRLDASLSKEIKAFYAKGYQLSRKCNELYQKHRKD